MKLKTFNKSKVLDLLHRQNIQISGNTIIELDEFVEKLIIEAIKEIKININVKRVTGEMLIAYIVKYVLSNRPESNKCLKCYGIKDVFLKAAKDLQSMVIDEAKIALTKLEKGGKYVS